LLLAFCAACHLPSLMILLSAQFALSNQMNLWVFAVADCLLLPLPGNSIKVHPQNKLPIEI
jgi:hypothetical protein